MIFRGKDSSDHGIAPVRHITGHIEEWEEAAVDYLDGRLDPQTRALVDEHLSGCPVCAARMQAQQGMMRFLRTTPAEAAPSELEDTILEEILFPRTPEQAARRYATEQPERRSGLSTWWQRRMVPWVPATVAVVAVLAAIVVFGVVRPQMGSSEEAALTTAAAAATTAKDGGQVATLDAAPETTAAPTASTNAAMGTEELAMGAVVDTTTAGAYVAAAEPAMAPSVHDRQGMIDTLTAAAGAPAYFVFEGPVLATDATGAPGGTGPGDTPETTVPSPLTGEGVPVLSGEQAEAIATEIIALTGLQPLDDEALTFGTPTFAALVPLESAEALVDLLRDISDSLGLTVSLTTQLDATITEQVDRLLAAQEETGLAELAAARAAELPESEWSFTTSTLPQDPDEPPEDEESTQSTEPRSPNGAGTYVLVVILMNTLR